MHFFRPTSFATSPHLNQLTSSTLILAITFAHFHHPTSFATSPHLNQLAIPTLILAITFAHFHLPYSFTTILLLSHSINLGTRRIRIT
jgi:hypothetical protein